MATLSRNPLCRGCKQDLLRDCPETLGVNRGHPCFVQTIYKFAQAGAQAGLGVGTLIQILQAGVPMTAVLDLIESRLEQQRCGHGTSDAYLEVQTGS
jgi:hypothetical protein